LIAWMTHCPSARQAPSALQCYACDPARLPAGPTGRSDPLGPVVQSPHLARTTRKTGWNVQDLTTSTDSVVKEHPAASFETGGAAEDGLLQTLLGGPALLDPATQTRNLTCHRPLRPEP